MPLFYYIVPNAKEGNNHVVEDSDSTGLDGNSILRISQKAPAPPLPLTAEEQADLDLVEREADERHRYSITRTVPETSGREVVKDGNLGKPTMKHFLRVFQQPNTASIAKYSENIENMSKQSRALGSVEYWPSVIRVGDSVLATTDWHLLPTE